MGKRLDRDFHEVKLGDDYICHIMDIKGTITAKSEYLSGHHRVELTYVNDTGEIYEQWLDWNMVARA